jgi:two-component system, NtrC family, sensor kinase
VRLFNETKEALERQRASAEVLAVISNSIADTTPVFEKIVESCERLFAGKHVGINLVGPDGGVVVGAYHGPNREDFMKVIPAARADDTTATGRAIRTRTVLHYPDIEAPDVPEGARIGGRASGMKAALYAPMLWEGKGLGVIWVAREYTGPFSEKDIALLKTFADQAVIAIQNARLFNETKEALERQTATADILKVIASSPSDVQPVFDAIAASARRLFGYSVTVSLVQGDQIVKGAAVGWGDAAKSVQGRFPRPLDRETITGRIILDGKVQHVPDTQAPDQPQRARELNRAVGAHALLGAPMVREGKAIGAIMVARGVPGAFSDKQIELLQTFADQAVIAIENVRLFEELQSRTEALTKSVGQLTALGEVGQAISSTLDLETVLQTIVARAVQLTGLEGGTIYEYDEANEVFRLQAADRQAPELLSAVRSVPIRKGDGTVGRVALTLEPAQVPDILDESYKSSRKDLLVRAGYRGILTVPLLHEQRIIGALSVTRKTPGLFSDEIVELLKTFATQSAMAIQNARLFREIEEKGKQLEEASKHKSQFLASMSHELRTPLNAILGFNEMILGDVYGEVPADMKEPLTDIQTSGKHLLRLINNVLDLAKIEAGRMELAIDEYSVHDTVESVRATLRPLAEAKGLELAVDVPPDIPLARGDGGRITQCLMNLAGNSLKFTKRGSVGISVALANGTLTYKVQDTGIGIPADKIGGLFTEFKQTDATIASEYGGTGLGLSITKKFIEMHGGRIWAESEPGSGSTFVFEVPLRAGEASNA